MVFSTQFEKGNIMRIPMQIMEMERALKSLKWWQVIKKIKYNNALSNMRYEGAIIGFNQAIKDLKRLGKLK